METIYDIKNPPKRKIQYGRLPVTHHYVMIFPEDFYSGIGSKINRRAMLTGKPYTSFFDSFLEDCVKRMSDSQHAYQLHDTGEFGIMHACLN